MGILEKTFTKRTERGMLPTLRPMEVNLTSNATGETRPNIDRSDEFELRLHIVVPFWANKAQFHNARNAAMKVLATTLYEDALREVSRLRLCIHSGDALGALDCADRIEGLSLATHQDPQP